MTTVLDYDVLVIGGGIAGCSVAYFMAPHAKVRVLEREAFPGMHSTGRSAALFNETYGPPQVLALTRASRPFFEQPPGGFIEGPILTPRGSLTIGSDEQVSLVKAELEAVKPNLPSARLLAEKEIQAIVPVLRPEAARVALFDAGAADMDVNGLQQGFIRGLKARGGELTTGEEIVSIENVQGRWHVKTSSSLLRAPLLINAAGAWADEVARAAGVAPIGLEPRRRSAFLFTPPAGVDASGWPFVCAVDEAFYFKPDAGLLLGSSANADPASPHDVQPEELDIATGIYRIEEATTMQIQRPTRTWAGLRSFVADGDIVAGFAPDAPGFFWIAALGGFGIQTCAAVGEATASVAFGRAMPAHLQDAGVSEAMLRGSLRAR
jgi:D-arginine dehydrogenase